MSLSSSINYEDESWSQTLITITPEEDAVLREVKSDVLISANADRPLDLAADSIGFRQPLRPKYLVDTSALDEDNLRDVEIQTYLQGVPVVEIAIDYRDEATQTLYMTSPCLPLKHYKDVMTSMVDTLLPVINNTQAIQTIITFSPSTPQSLVLEKLDNIDVTAEDLTEDEFVVKTDEEDENIEMLIQDLINFLFERTFWITDPIEKHREMINNHAQSSIRHNKLTNHFVLDEETQTNLTCEPKYSNTQLLAEYHGTKEFMRNILEDCLANGTELRIIVDTFLDEVIVNCAERIRLPPKDQNIQTIASYSVQDEKIDEILRKLRISLVIDPLEASVVVLPLLDDILQVVCSIINYNGRRISEDIINDTINKSVKIGSKLQEMKQQQQGKPLDKLLDERRKKIAELLEKKQKTESTATQTGIGGIDNVDRLKDTESFCCAVCMRHANCHWCMAARESKEVLPEHKQELELLRTQDILLVYKPCYVVPSLTKSVKAAAPLKPPSLKLASKHEFRTSSPGFSICSPDEEEVDEDSTSTINVFLQSQKSPESTDSFSGWTRAINNTLFMPWPKGGSKSSVNKSCMDSYDRTKKNSKSNETITSQSTKALQILKKTFCNQENCCSIKELKKDLSHKEGSIRSPFENETLLCCNSTPVDRYERSDTTSRREKNSKLKYVPVRHSRRNLDT